MKKTPIKLLVLLLALLLLALLLLSGCGGGDASPGTGKETDGIKTSEKAEAVDTEAVTFKTIEAAEIPADYPRERFVLSDNIRDKLIKVNQSSDTLTFDLKIISMRPAREVVEEYAEVWKLENENTMFLDDIGSATLSGTADGFDVIVNASEQSPDIPKGARSYCAILVKKTE